MQYLNESELKDAGIDIGCKIEDAIKSADRFLPQPGFSTSRMYNEGGELWISEIYARAIADKKSFKGFRRKNPINLAKTKKNNKDMTNNSNKTRYGVKYSINELKKVFKLNKHGDRLIRVAKSPTAQAVIIYDRGVCDNESGKTSFKGMNYDIRSVLYCLINDCDYLDARYSTIYPLTDKDTTKLYKFDIGEVKCVLPDGTEWKDYKISSNTQPELNFEEDIEEEVAVKVKSSKPTRKDVMEYCNTPNKWDVAVNGTTFSFSNKEAMIEMCRELAIK